MRTQALLSILLLCVLLLQARGGQRSQGMNHLKAKACTKRPKEFTCENHCSYFQHCPQNTVCCSTFCGNVCMNIL